MAKSWYMQTRKGEIPMDDSRIKQRLWQFSRSGFGKGVAVTAILFITALVLVAGTMGAGALGGLSVGGVMLPDFGAGVVAGFSKMVAFLATTPIGWGTLAAGGLVGSYLQRKRDNELIAMDALVSKEEEKVRELEQQLAMQPAVQQAPQRSDLRSEAPIDDNRAAPVDPKTAEQIYSEGYLNGIKNAKGTQESPTHQETQAKSEQIRHDTVTKTEPVQPDKDHVNQVYSQGYLDGIRMSTQANARTPSTVDRSSVGNSNNSGNPPVVNVQNVTTNDQRVIDQRAVNVEVPAPTLNQTVNDNSMSQMATTSTNSPGDPAKTSSASFAAAELQRQTEREIVSTKRTV